jgi:ribosomal protein S18 acetylase RimI-like enzyme
MEPEYEIRDARPDDKARLFRLMGLAHVEQNGKDGREASTDDAIVHRSIDVLVHNLSEGNARCWVAVTAHNDLPVAYAYVSASVLGNGIFTHQVHRHHGLATALLAERQKHEMESGNTASTLNVLPDNAEAISLYEGLGYRIDPNLSSKILLTMVKPLPVAAPAATPSEP